MFIIFGFGKTTKKSYGFMNSNNCGRCGNNVQNELLKITTWFTLFFIPVIPYKTEYISVCPICNSLLHLSKEDFMRAADGENAGYTDGAQDDSIKYAGKTPTQISYLKQMEELEREKAERTEPQ